ncbi:MAG: Rrf2 family transcriptional regulator [Campylobacterales bacterium]
MLLTKASEYALLSLAVIAKSDKPVDASTIAEQLGIPKSFLAKILQNLAKSDILRSYKGINGGFELTHPLSSITIMSVIKAVEEKPANVFECSGNAADCPSDRAFSCHIWPFLYRLQCKVDRFLEGVTLDELLGE